MRQRSQYARAGLEEDQSAAQRRGTAIVEFTVDRAMNLSGEWAARIFAENRRDTARNERLTKRSKSLARERHRHAGDGAPGGPPSDWQLRD